MPESDAERTERERMIRAGEIVPFEPYRKIANDPIPKPLKKTPEQVKRGKRKGVKDSTDAD